MNLVIIKKIELSFIKDVCQILFAIFFLALFAKVYISLFFTPVPIVLQNSIAITYGYFLKSKKAFLSILGFIFLGAIGMPVFSDGRFGIDFLLSAANGGYILSYVLATYVIGRFFEKKENRTSKEIGLIILLGHFIVLFCGFLWFSFFINAGMKKAFMLGVLPFIAGDIFKTIAITKLIKLKNRF